jgi:hypothetical protein
LLTPLLLWRVQVGFICYTPAPLSQSDVISNLIH